MPWVLETLTPVFIGSGQEPASPLDFLIEPDGSGLRFVSFDDLVEALEDPLRLVEWMERRSRPSLRELLDQPWAEPFRARVYQAPLIRVFTTQPTDGIREITRFLQDGLRRPYVPGTTLKGALRTALLYDYLTGDPSRLSRLLGPMRQEEERARERNRPFHPGRWLECQVFWGREQDATWDLLRAIAVADTAPIRPQRFFVGEVRLVGSRRNLSIHVEALMPQCQIQVLPVRSARDQVQALAMMQSQRRLWDSSLATLFTDGWPPVAQACYRWSRDLLVAEIDHWQWLERDGAPIARDVIGRLQELHDQNQEDRPLLRIGMHRGALSLTVGLAIRNQLGSDSEAYRWWARRIVRGNRPVSARSPQTRKAIYYQGRWWPLGWVRIGPEPEPK